MVLKSDYVDFTGLTIEHAVIAASFCKMVHDFWTMEKVPAYMQKFLQDKPNVMVK